MRWLRKLLGRQTVEETMDDMSKAIIAFIQKSHLGRGQEFHGDIMSVSGQTPEIHFIIGVCGVPGGCGGIAKQMEMRAKADTMAANNRWMN